MRIPCLLVVLLAGSAPTWGGDIVFYDGFESGDTAGWWAPARVGKTGQVTCYEEDGTIIDDCTGTGQDGDLQPGVAWPNPRFVDNGEDGTVTDMLTGLIWLKDASCSDLAYTNTDGQAVWVSALTATAVLANGTCGLSDGSVGGDWRLPSINELQSLSDYEYYGPALSDAAGTGQWSEGDPFSDVQVMFYWSSSSSARYPDRAWGVNFFNDWVYDGTKATSQYVWPVRGGL